MNIPFIRGFNNYMAFPDYFEEIMKYCKFFMPAAPIAIA